MEVRLELEDHTVTDAWCVGTMYRGFEQILLGRDPGDALVIAPRICGICSTSQLYAAASALETAYNAPVAPNGTRIRNLCLMAESVMSDARHTFLMFTPDFCNDAYRDHPLHAARHGALRAAVQGPPRRRDRRRDEAHPGHCDRFRRPVAALDVHDARRRHVPLDASRLDECAAAIDAYAEWYERAILGCTCDEWLSLQAADDFHAWMEAPAHRESAVGVFTTFGRSIGLHELGQRHPASAQLGLLLRPRALAAAVRRAPVPPARWLLRRRARRDPAVPARGGRRAPALRQVRRPGRRPPSVGERDGPGRRERRGLQLREGDALQGPRGPARAAGGPRARAATPSSTRCSPRTGRRPGCASSPGCIGPW